MFPNRPRWTYSVRSSQQMWQEYLAFVGGEAPGVPGPGVPAAETGKKD